MQGFSIQEPQGLRSPIVVVAFTGWSDTGTVTTDAAKRMVDAYQAQRFLEVDPEEYYVFTDTRPQVKLDAGQLPLDQLLTRYQRGAELLAYCRARLDAVENQIKVMENGEPKPWDGQ